MATVTFDHVTKKYGEVDRRRRPQPRDPGRRVHGPRRPVGLRQDHQPADDRRPRGHHRRARSRSATGSSTTSPPKDRDIAMVFQSYALYPHMSVYDNLAFGLKLRKVAKKEIDRRVKEAAETIQLDDAPRAQAEGALRRPAPARRPRPGHRPRAGRLPHGRAALQPRRQAARPDPRRDRAPPPAPQDDDRLRHPRPGRGDDDGRADRGHEPGEAPAGRHAAGALRPPRQQVRGRLHRQPGDELHRRSTLDGTRRDARRSRPRASRSRSRPPSARASGRRRAGSFIVGRPPRAPRRRCRPARPRHRRRRRPTSSSTSATRSSSTSRSRASTSSPSSPPSGASARATS